MPDITDIIKTQKTILKKIQELQVQQNWITMVLNESRRGFKCPYCQVDLEPVMLKMMKGSDESHS